MRFKSFRSELLFGLLTPLLVLVALDAWITYQDAHEVATQVQDRMLLGAAKMIGQQTSLDHGALQVEVPPAALELFAASGLDRVTYRVSQGGGELLAGYADLDLPQTPPEADQAVFFDSQYQTQAVRVVAYAQPIFLLPQHAPLLIEVAQTQAGHRAMVRDIWASALRRQLLLLTLVGVLIGLGLRHAMRPLVDLRSQMLLRQPGSLDALQVQHLPSELHPLVQALNDYVARLNRHMQAHSRFIADASHQLRTPLTILNTQIVYAIRQGASASTQDALKAIHQTTEQASRLIQQLLLHARTEAALTPTPVQEHVALAPLVQRALEAFALQAETRRIDLGCELGEAPLCVQGAEQMLFELLSNLIDNALRYTAPGGVVTVRAERQAGAPVLSVEDNGPGIAASERTRVFERFYRVKNTHSDGCGLGLAIVKSIADALHARVELQTPPSGQGLLVNVVFPPPGTP